MLRKLESCIDGKLVSTFSKRLVAEFLQIEVDLLAEKLPVKVNRLFDDCEKIRNDCLTFKISLSPENFTQKFNELKKINLEKIKSFNEKFASTFWSQKTNYNHHEGGYSALVFIVLESKIRAFYLLFKVKNMELLNYLKETTKISKENSVKISSLIHRLHCRTPSGTNLSEPTTWQKYEHK